MPFPFGHVCDLLDQLEKLESRGLTPRTRNAAYAPIIKDWFVYFRADLPAETWTPLFSSLFPELRCDRRYGIKEDGLLRLVSKALGLGNTRRQQLEQWKETTRGDLGIMVGIIMQRTEISTSFAQTLNVEDIDTGLDNLASYCKFSSKQIQQQRIQNQLPSSSIEHNKRLAILQPLYNNLTSSQAKWLTRMILRSFLPVEMAFLQIFDIFHFLLPDIYSLQSDLKRSLSLLSGPSLRLFPSKPRNDELLELKKAGRRLLQPQIGIKLGRLEFIKATSCTHAVKLASRRRMALDRKYDGEYCQIHINLTNTTDWLKIFSKSGRNSTEDRTKAHEIIRKCLRIDEPEKRAFKKYCVVECEFLVYSTKEERIMEFCYIKNHVTRSGIYMGSTSRGTRAEKATQHVMLMFFDCLVVDDVCSPANSWDSRRQHLRNVMQEIPTKAEITLPTILDFTKSSTKDELEVRFAQGVAARWEGFVLKPCEGDYFNTDRSNAWIKLKKDYIYGCGDTGDFAIVGGCFEHRRGRERRLDSTTPTTFHVGCLTNKRDTMVEDAKPSFHVVFTVSYCLTKQDLMQLKLEAQFNGLSLKSASAVEAPFECIPHSRSIAKMDFLFHKPPIFEIYGGGFDKDEDGRFWVLRWPRVSKVHFDRDIMDATDLDGLQEMARGALKEPDDLPAEEMRWITKLSLPSNIVRDSSPAMRLSVRPVRSTNNSLGNTVASRDKPSTNMVLGETCKQLEVAREDRLKTRLPRTSQGLNNHPIFVSLESRVMSRAPNSPRIALGENQNITNISILPISRHKRWSSFQPTPSTPSRKRQRNSQTSSQPPCFPLSPNSLASKKALQGSPLKDYDIYLMSYLSTGTEISDSLSELGLLIKGFCVDMFKLDNLKGTVILLVEERKRAELRVLMRRLYDARVPVRVEVYSCRILQQVQLLLRETESQTRKSMKSVDWSLWHLESI